jgi:hypothetical protein
LIPEKRVCGLIDEIRKGGVTKSGKISMMRIIQYKVLKRQGKESLNIDGWESGVTAERIQKVLGSWDADGLPDGYYRLTKPDEDVRIILNAFGADADLRLPAATELRQLKYSFDKAAFI